MNTSHSTRIHSAIGKPKSSHGGGATVVFKRSLNMGAMSEQERLVARELLQRLISPPADRPKS